MRIGMETTLSTTEKGELKTTVLGATLDLCAVPRVGESIIMPSGHLFTVTHVSYLVAVCGDPYLELDHVHVPFTEYQSKLDVLLGEGFKIV